MIRLKKALVALGVGALSVLATTLGARRPAEAEGGAIDDYLTVYKVLESPRCLNCHPNGDSPLQGDASQPHQMDVTRRSPEVGLNCTTCHRETNGPTPGSPPGVPGWRLPPRAMPMVFQGKNAHDVCEQLKDPARNGHKTFADLKEHFESDTIVLWGWNPGPGRTLPPTPHAELAAAAAHWLDAGAPCPP